MAQNTDWNDVQNPMFPSVKEGNNEIRIQWDGRRVINGSILYRPTQECKDWDGTTAEFAVGNRHGSYSYVDVAITGRTIQKVNGAFCQKCQIQFWHWNQTTGLYELGEKVVGWIYRPDHLVISSFPE